jgi:hypothetical protein
LWGVKTWRQSLHLVGGLGYIFVCILWYVW